MDFSGAFLNEANVTSADLFRTIFRRAQLEKSNFSGSKMTYAVLIEANLNEADFSRTDLSNLILSDANWLSLLDTWKVKGAEEINQHYKMIESATFYKDSKYQLVLKQ